MWCLIEPMSMVVWYPLFRVCEFVAVSPRLPEKRVSPVRGIWNQSTVLSNNIPGRIPDNTEEHIEAKGAFYAGGEGGGLFCQDTSFGR